MSKIIDFNNHKVTKMGVCNLNIRQFAKFILYFANDTTIKLYKTKINKLLFYTQFLYFKNYDEDILGAEFICDYYGPAIENIDSLLSEVERTGLITIKSTCYGNYVSPNYTLSNDLYTDKELFILNKVSSKFKNYSSSAISEYSHKEPLWIDTEIKSIIPLENARYLNDF